MKRLDYAECTVGHKMTWRNKPAVITDHNDREEYITFEVGGSGGQTYRLYKQHVEGLEPVYDGNQRFTVKKGVWPVAIAGNDTTYYVVDFMHPLADGDNPFYFTQEAQAEQLAERLNQANERLYFLSPFDPIKKAWGVYRRKKTNKQCVFRLATTCPDYANAAATALGLCEQVPEYEYRVQGDKEAWQLADAYRP